MGLTRRIRPLALAAFLGVGAAGSAQAHGDGPHVLPIVPKDMSIFVAMPLWL